MYIVNVEGSDPFIAANKNAIYKGLDDLYDGSVHGTICEGDNQIRFLYMDNIGEGLNIVADKTEVYR